MSGGGDDLPKIRLVIADDQALIRTGLRLVAQAAPDIEVVGEATDGLQALSMTRRLRPDVLLMDIAMPRMDGLSAARRLLAEPSPPGIVMLTTFDTDENLHASLRIGVSGFLLKTSPPERLIEAVRLVASGDALIDPSATRRVITSFADLHEPETPPELATLTPRELQVLSLLSQGLSNDEIASECRVGGAAVRTHIARMLRKLGLRNRVQAVAFAYEAGIARPGRRPRR